MRAEKTTGGLHCRAVQLYSHGVGLVLPRGRQCAACTFVMYMCKPSDMAWQEGSMEREARRFDLVSVPTRTCGCWRCKDRLTPAKALVRKRRGPTLVAA